MNCLRIYAKTVKQRIAGLRGPVLCYSSSVRAKFTTCVLGFFHVFHCLII